MCMYIHLYVYMHVYIGTYMHMGYTYIKTGTYMHMGYTYIKIHTYTHIHIYAYLLQVDDNKPTIYISHHKTTKKCLFNK